MKDNLSQTMLKPQVWMIAEFTDPKLAHWACLAANLCNEIDEFTLSKNLRALGFGNIISFGT